MLAFGDFAQVFFQSTAAFQELAPEVNKCMFGVAFCSEFSGCLVEDSV